jgi:NADPH-dependent 2,4-dienoyl-CoA reductase/sulfur reductase-like enzyme
MRYIIIGGSAAGISAVEAIRSVDRTSPIELFSSEGTPFYSRVLLSYYMQELLQRTNYTSGHSSSSQKIK